MLLSTVTLLLLLSGSFLVDLKNRHTGSSLRKFYLITSSPEKCILALFENFGTTRSRGKSCNDCEV